MVTKTYQAQLEEVQAAISAVLNNAQSVSIKGRAYELANLETLYKMESALRAKAKREEEGGIRIRGATPTG
jgi:hypothetical protein